MVSVLMIAYNQEKYIAEAITSVLMQETDFPFELIISDDASTDNTKKIISDIIKNHPKGGLIGFYDHVSNLGMKANFTFTIEQCRGKYIAICEGDDYWTDPAKLQRQVDFLETNNDYALCFHQTITLYEDGTELMYNNFTEDTRFEFLDLVQRPFISTVSSLFKNPNPLPAWFADIASDWPLFLHIASQGKLYYMKDCMAVYRRHSEGVWSSLSNDEKYNNTMGLLTKLDAAFNLEYHSYFERAKQLRHEIHYPPASVPVKTPLLFRIKHKIKTLLFPGN
ncbi:MAG: glycosyltransferase [Ferruginibacter sp.]